MLNPAQKLPSELTSLVNYSLGLLGRAIRLHDGDPIYKEVERIRVIYKKARLSSAESLNEIHKSLHQNLKKKGKKDQLALAHAFTVSLELINICENAYRSLRLSEKPYAPIVQPMQPIIFVLTAHPTEARSAKSIKIANSISELLRKKIENNKFTKLNDDELFHQILLLVKTPLSKQKSPTVEDEAEYIYSTVLKKENIEILCKYYLRNQPVFLRTWVGGDKDGHPGVTSRVMLNSLNLSRRKIMSFVMGYIESCARDLDCLPEDTKGLRGLKRKVLSVKAHLKVLRTIKDGDGHRLKQLYKTIEHVARAYEKTMGVASPEIEKLQALMGVFPGLVIPLELREDAALIKEALTDSGMEIAKMLKALRKVSQGGDPTHYARGFIISMCESSQDVKNAVGVSQKYFGSLRLPIVPLFETRKALVSSSDLAKEIIKISSFQSAMSKYWDDKFEVMLGYSDSAKESGALFSRVMIHKTLSQLDRLIRSSGFTPIFFHGSGGSVARGGGALKEQMSWWPKSAQIRFKATIQGEMIHRNFSTSEIFERQIHKIQENALDPEAEATKSEVLSGIEDFANKVRLQYLNRVEDEDFMDMVEKATPYPYLDQLRIGSRPSKRKSNLSLKSLRAIPWVLCWTQTRVLFPVWWGVGSSWEALGPSEQKLLKVAFQKSSLFRSFVTVLAYTLAKVDLSVWAFCLGQSKIQEDQKGKYLKEFKQEFKKTKAFIMEVSGQTSLLWFRPWLAESIRYRSTMIYPLNILEVEALEKNNMPLLRETVTGVASGMLTTG